MKYLLFIMVVSQLISCQENDSKSIAKYPDLLRENLKGDLHVVELFNFVVNGAGELIPDSLHYELLEWKDGYLRHHTELDSSRKNKLYFSYFYYENGMLKTIVSELNGKPNFRMEAEVDSNGHNITGRTFDSSGKMDYFDTNLKENEVGQVISGTAYNGDSVFLYAYSSTYKGRQFLRNVNSDSTGKIKQIIGVKLQADNEIIADSIIRFGKDSTSTTIRQYQYNDYDSLKNWLQRTELSAAGVPIRVTKRKITYVKK